MSMTRIGQARKKQTQSQERRKHLICEALSTTLSIGKAIGINDLRPQ